MKPAALRSPPMAARATATPAAPALVLDAAQRSALAATRSLGRRCVPVIAADVRQPTLAGRSRFARAVDTYTDPESAPERFLEDVDALAQRHGAGVVLPMTEITTHLLARTNPTRAPTVIAAPPSAAFELLSDKWRLFELAARLEVPIPPTRFVERAADAPACAAQLGYPVVVKPYRSRVPVGDRWQPGEVRLAASEDELRALVARDPALHDHHFLLQGYVEGTGQGLFAAWYGGEAVALFAHRRIREKPPSGGVSVVSESVPVSAPMRDAATRLLEAVDWQGLAMVEFKVAADGTPFLIEVNPRPWGSMQLAVDAGVDFPWLLYQMCKGLQLDRVTSYRQGQRLRWLLGDLDRLYLALREGATPRSRRLREIAAFLRPRFRHVRHEINRWDDMGPCRHELARYLNDLRPGTRERPGP